MTRGKWERNPGQRQYRKSGHSNLPQPVMEPHLESVHAIDIALANQGYFVAQIPPQPDVTLLCGARVGGISDGYVMRHLFLHGDASASRRGDADQVGIDAYPAHAE